MTLTVPTAGSVAGRAPQLRVEAPETAGIVAAFGQRMADVGNQWKQEQRQRQTTQTLLDATREFGVARQEVEQIGDPAAIGPAWDTRRAAIAQKYITPDMDPEVANALRLSMQELGDRHSLALGNRVIGLRQSQQQADWLTTRQTIAAEAVNADPETLGAYLELGQAAIDTRAQQGVITPEQAAQEKIALQQEVYGNRADALLQTDPQGMLDQIKAGQWNMLGDGLAARKQTAERAVAEQAARAAKDAETAAKAQTDAIGKRIDEMIRIVGKGGTPIDLKETSNPLVQQHPKYPELAAALSLQSEEPGIRTMTVAELDRQIAAEKGKPVAAEYQMERLAVLEGWRAEAVTKSATDPVGYVRDIGLSVPELPPLDPADPGAFAQGLSARLSFDAATRQNRPEIKSPAVFAGPELAAIKEAADPKAAPETRLAVARSFAAQGEKNAAYLASVVGADPVLRRATVLLGSIGDQELATEMLRGAARIETKTVQMPSTAEQVRVFDEIAAGVFDANPAAKAELMAAAAALYADKAVPVETGASAGVFNDSAAVDAYTAAVQRVLGGRQDTNGSYSIGGVQEFNGAKVVLPPGVPVEAVNTAWDNIEQQLAGYRYTSRKEAFGTTEDPVFAQRYGGPDAKVWVEDPQANPLRAFAGASIYPGDLPNLGPNAADMLYDYQPRPVMTPDGRMSDVYELTYQRNGMTEVVRVTGSPNGRAFRFKLSDLIRGAQQ